MSTYSKLIKETIESLYGKEIGDSLDARAPRWIEGWMRLECGTLDGLGHERFRREVRIALRCVTAAEERENEQLANSIVGPAS